MPMPVGEPMWYAWVRGPKDTSTQRPSGPCGMCCAHALTAKRLSLHSSLVRNTGVRLSAKRIHE